MRLRWWFGLLALPLFGCPLESKVPLGPPSRGDYNPALVGRWRCLGFGSGSDADKMWPIEFRPAGDARYEIFAPGMGEHGEDVTCPAYVTRVRHVPILNVQTDKDSWIFVRYLMHGDGVLHLENLEGDLFAQVPETSRELKRQVAKRIHKAKLFQDLFICARADRETAPSAPPPDPAEKLPPAS